MISAYYNLNYLKLWMKNSRSLSILKINLTKQLSVELEYANLNDIFFYKILDIYYLKKGRLDFFK